MAESTLCEREELYQEAIQRRQETIDFGKRLWQDNEGVIESSNALYFIRDMNYCNFAYQRSFKEILGEKLYRKVKHADSHPVLNLMSILAMTSSAALGAYIGSEIGGETEAVLGGFIGLFVPGIFPVSYFLSHNLQDKYREKIISKLKEENPRHIKYIDAYFE